MDMEADEAGFPLQGEVTCFTFLIVSLYSIRFAGQELTAYVRGRGDRKIFHLLEDTTKRRRREIR
jgi:hypothetical protein